MERSLSWNMQPNIVNIVQKLPIKIEIKNPNVSIHTLMIANVKYKWTFQIYLKKNFSNDVMGNCKYSE